jgi:putative DNA primase/helicase
MGGLMAEFAKLPPALLNALTNRKRTGAVSGDVSAGAPILNGNRNVALTRMAGAMQRQGIPAEAQIAALLKVNDDLCLPPKPDAEVIGIVQSVGRYKPAISSEAALSTPRTPYQYTDWGNAERLVAWYGQDFRYVSDQGVFYVWSGRHWELDQGGLRMQALMKLVIRDLYAEAAAMEEDEARKKHLDWARRSESKDKLAAAVALSQSEPGVALTSEAFDRDDSLLNTESGTVELQTLTLRSHRREDKITMCCPYPFDPSAEAPRFQAFLERIFPDPDLRAYMKRALGYSCTGHTGEEVLFYCLGGGRNGKTKLIEAVREALGPHAQATRPDILMARDRQGIPNDIAALVGARFVSATEVEEGKRWAENEVKGLTGGDTRQARLLYHEFFTFRIKCKFWIAANYKLEIRGTDPAIWARIHLVPFLVTIPPEERDKHLLDKLRAEAPGILRYLCEGAGEWFRVGLLPPKSVLAAVAEYRAESDILASFLDDSCIQDASAETPSAALYAAYREWCDTTGERAMSSTKFGLKLKERGFEKGKTARARTWKGLGLLASEVAV